jgi:hypothetical protein
MKTFLCLSLSVFVASFSASAVDVDARLLRFNGEVPAADLVRLANSNSMPALRAFSATLGADGSFSYRALSPVAYPTEWDSTGKWLSTEDRDTGVLFSGHAKPSDGSYVLDFQFRFVEFTSTGVSRTDTSATVAQPIFQHHEQKSKVTLPTGEWTLVALPDDRESHLALLVRVRK